MPKQIMTNVRRSTMKEKRDGFPRFISLVLVILFVGLLASSSYVYGDEDEKKKDLPPRGMSVAPEYPGVIVPEGEDVSVDLEVTNKGRQDEDIEISLPSVPEGWKAWVKTYSFGVTGVHVASDSKKNLTLKAEPDKGVGPGKYTFPIKANTSDGELTSSTELVITVEKEEKEKKAKGVQITTSYPVLQGPTDATFEFSLDVENETDKDTIFNLAHEGPKNWEIRFKPAYEDKYFSSLRIKADASQSMAVEVKPFPFSEPGRYPIKVKVSSDKAKAEAELMVVLTGTYKLDAGTADGRLSLSGFQGRPANLSFYIKNSGSAAQSNVKFLSFKPENWKVEFEPENIETLEPGGLKQVEAIITPADQALVGDYSVSLRIEGEKANKDMEMRFTVRASTAWGWIGIGIIVLVIAGLVVLFVRLGRR
jgi:uncharacterized membrane protein